MTPPPLNSELIRSRAADIRRELEVLRAYAALPEPEFTGSAEKVRAARYSLIVAVEAAAAICNHLATRHGQVPDSYPGCFEALVTLGVADAALGARLASMARLRNILVHGYARVDDRRLHTILRENLGDLDGFLDGRTILRRRGPVRDDVLSRGMRPPMDQARRSQIRTGIATALAAESGVVSAYLFGSTLSADSVGDVDVAVLLDPERHDSQRSVDAQLHLTARLERILGIPVDVVILNDAPLGLRLAAVRGLVVYSRDDAKRQAFVEQTTLQAMDSAFLRRESLRDVLSSR